MDAVVFEAAALLLALGVASFCSGAIASLNRLHERGIGAPDDDEQLDPKVSETLSWWRARRRAVALALALGHRLGLAAVVVLAVTIAYRSPLQLTTTGVVALVAVTTVAAVAICDIVPQMLGRAFARRFGVRALRMLRLPYLLFYPLIRALVALRGAVADAVGADDDDQLDEESVDEQMVFKQLVERQTNLSDRRRLLRSVVEFPATTVREVMVPRTDMVTICRQMDLEEILTILLECGHSRIPVRGENLDDIVGLFYAKDVIQLMASGREFDIDEFLREPYFVPETKPISDLLTEFQRERIHLAVVVDEFGGTEGLITLEDIIEEIFGDIQDEYDVEPSQLVELSPTTVLADARIGVDEIEEHFDIELPEDGEYDSLGGFLLDQTGGVPEAGDELRWESLLFRVVEADAKRVDTVEIESVGQPPDRPAELVS